MGSLGMVWGHEGWWGPHKWGFGVTRDGLGSPGMVGRARMGIWGHQGWYGVTRDGRETEDEDLGSPGMVWGHQV